MIWVMVIIGLSVQLIFLFKRELLFDVRKFKVILLTSLALFVLSYLLPSGNPMGYEFLRVPFLALLIFFVMSKAYKAMFGSNPKDSFSIMSLSLDMSLMKDGIFNFLFWVLGTMIPVLLAYKVL